jgi:hypothetical protein
VTIVHVRALDRSDEAAIGRMLSELAQELGRPCNPPVEDVWCPFTPVSQIAVVSEVRDKAGSIA